MTKICQDCKKMNVDENSICRFCNSSNLSELKDDFKRDMIEFLIYWKDEGTGEYRYAKSKIIYWLFVVLSFISQIGDIHNPLSFAQTLQGSFLAPAIFILFPGLVIHYILTEREKNRMVNMTQNQNMMGDNVNPNNYNTVTQYETNNPNLNNHQNINNQGMNNPQDMNNPQNNITPNGGTGFDYSAENNIQEYICPVCSTKYPNNMDNCPKCGTKRTQ